MYSKINLLGLAARVLISTSLLLLVGCSNGSRTVQGAKIASSPTQIKIISSLTVKGFDIPGLLHIEPSTYGCNSLVGSYQFFFDNNLVLAQKRLTYDTGELEQMKAYFKKLTDKSLNNVSTISQPTTLRWMQGSPTELPEDYEGCISSFQITNIGNATIQIQTITMRLDATQPNDFQYHLINACSLPISIDCPPTGLGAGQGLAYSYVLKSAPVGARFQPRGQNTPIALDPGQLANIILFFGSGDNLIYTVTPELVLGAQRIELESFSGKVTFANKDQFSCYSLQRSTFVTVSFESGWCI